MGGALVVSLVDAPMNWVVAAVVAVVGCVLYLWRGWSSSGHEDAFAAAVKDVIADGAEPPCAKAPAAVQRRPSSTVMRSARKSLARATGIHHLVSPPKKGEDAPPIEKLDCRERTSNRASGVPGKDVETEARLPYHEASGLDTRNGYIGCLTPSQQTALATLLHRARLEGLDLRMHMAPHGETVEQLALRFLRARNFRAAAAFGMLRRDVKWREDVARLRLLRKAAPRSVIGLDGGAPDDTIGRLFPMWVEGQDRQGRPVFYKRFGCWRLDELVSKHGVTPAGCKAYLTFAQDRAFHAALGRASERTGRSIEQVVVVLDARDLRWAWGLPSKDGLALTHSMIQLDQNFYPERLGQLFIVNTNANVTKAWEFLSRVVDRRTKDKINILAGPSEHVPVLKAAIGEDQLAREYGGKGAARTGQGLYDPIS